MGRLKFICCLLALALLAPTAFAPVPLPSKPVAKLIPIPLVGSPPITPDCRYLFVVDLSSAMQRIADGLYRTTHRLVASGLGGRMQEGDVFTVWTYADTVLNREFPLNAWTPDLNTALANRAHEFLAQQKFRGTSNLRPVFAELGQALVISPSLTVILVSDGTDVVVGTPFDRPINVTYGARASDMRSAKMPFITSLVTQRGEFTQWTVRGGLEDIGLPFPQKPNLLAPPLAPTPIIGTPAPTPPAAPIPVVITPKSPVPTNPSPVVVAKASEPVIPKPVPAPPPVAPNPVPKPTINAVAPTLPAPPKPTEPVPVVTPAKKAEPLPLHTPVPQQEAKVALLPPPKPVAVEPKLTPPVPQFATPVKPPEVRAIEPIPTPPPVPNTAVTVPPTKLSAAAPAEQKTSATTTSGLIHTNAPTVATTSVPTTAAPPSAEEKPVESAVPLAVVSPRARDGGWLHLAAAVALLILAGGIVTRFLRPAPQPSSISQSMDENRR